MSKVYATPVLFKDYNKSTKDLLTKSYAAPGSWKIESKYKGSKDTFFINPSASSDGKFATDIEYVASCDGGVKVRLTPALQNDLKVTASYNIQGHKVEATVSKKNSVIDYEFAHETVVAFGKRASINEKLTQTAVELGLGLDVAPNCQIGAGATYSLKDKKCNWNFGCRYAAKGYEVAVRTNTLTTFTTSMSVPVRFQCNGNTITLKLAAESNCGSAVKGWEGVVGFESTCPVRPANTLKARCDKNLNWAVAYIAKVADNWQMAVSLDKNLKAGILLTHS